MALLLRDLSLDIPVDEKNLIDELGKHLEIDPGGIRGLKIVRRSVDARKKSRIRRVYSLTFTCDNESTLLAKPGLKLEEVPDADPPCLPKLKQTHRSLVVGMGPAGLFAARRLAQSGAQVTLVDRGRPLEQRVSDVERFWESGRLNPASNVQFGEGGAGTFSDGKLTTRLNHPMRLDVLHELVACGAPEEILIDARPHVGTDRLRKVVVNFRKRLIDLGVDVRFEKFLTGLDSSDDCVHGGVFADGEVIPCDSLVLAPGHSARDTYRMLYADGVHLEAKGFAVGVRVEHPAELINQIQYGRFASQLPTADYALRYNDPESGRGVYSFCMCPGGEVVNASSDAGGVVVNGMSRMSRGSDYSNSALVVSVSPEDWGSTPLGGVDFQREWEQKAFVAAGENFTVPGQNMLSFCERGHGPVRSSCRPGIVETELREVLPDFVYHGLRRALPHFDRKMKGFVTSEAVLLGVETRTSAPLRIVRAETGESVNRRGLFPAGEGAGYAGGIMSAALDGLRTADRIVQSVVE